MNDAFTEAAYLIYTRFPIQRYTAKMRYDSQNGNKWVDVWDNSKNDFKWSRLRQLKNLSEHDVYTEVRILNDSYCDYINGVYEFLLS